MLYSFGALCHVSIALTLTHKETLHLFAGREVRGVMENLPVLFYAICSLAVKTHIVGFGGLTSCRVVAGHQRFGGHFAFP
jgi:hypothetical protein